MTMTDREVAALAAAMQSSACYLEYGAGNSTRMAVDTPGITSITSVESDPGYIRKHLDSNPDIACARDSRRLRFLVVDVGPTSEWGHPVNRSKSHLWPSYALCPYVHGYEPDLVLIDGRFRVACGLAAVLQCSTEATIFIHDFPQRPEYHVLLEFLRIEESTDALVRCRRAGTIREDRVRALLRSYLYFPDDWDRSIRSRALRVAGRMTKRFTGHEA